MSALIDIAQVSVYFGDRREPVRALHNISLQVNPGERVALIGANGCGKSTLLRLINGLIRPSSGQLKAQPQLQQAMVFQRPFMMRMSLQNNLTWGLVLQGQPWREARSKALLALQHVGLADLAARNARALSGGQQQRAALARACALAPQLLLLDEPTASLDPHAKREVEVLMERYARGELNPSAHAQQRAMVFASHNLGQVKRLATRVIYLEHGVALADMPVTRFFDQTDLGQSCPQAFAFLKGEGL